MGVGGGGGGGGGAFTDGLAVPLGDMRGHGIINNTANNLLRGPGFNINKLPAWHTHT